MTQADQAIERADPRADHGGLPRPRPRRRGVRHRGRRRAGSAGTSTRSTAPTTSSAACPCSGRCSPSSATARSRSGSSARRPSASAGTRRAGRRRVGRGCPRAVGAARRGGSACRRSPTWPTPRSLYALGPGHRGERRGARASTRSPRRSGASAGSATSGATRWSPRAPPRRWSRSACTAWDLAAPSDHRRGGRRPVTDFDGVRTHPQRARPRHERPAPRRGPGAAARRIANEEGRSVQEGMPAGAEAPIDRAGPAAATRLARRPRWTIRGRSRSSRPSTGACSPLDRWPTTKRSGEPSMFLTFLSATLIVIGFLVGAQGLLAGRAAGGHRPARSPTCSSGRATFGRLIDASGEELQSVRGMNRIRHAYREMVPGLEPYFVSGFHDDAYGVLATYGYATHGRPPGERLPWPDHDQRHDRHHRGDGVRRAVRADRHRPRGDPRAGHGRVDRGLRRRVRAAHGDRLSRRLPRPGADRIPLPDADRARRLTD